MFISMVALNVFCISSSILSRRCKKYNYIFYKYIIGMHKRFLAGTCTTNQSVSIVERNSGLMQ